MRSDIDEDRLADEVDFLHQRLFGGTPSPEVRRRYVDAHRHLAVGATASRKVNVDVVFQRNLDPEAVEFYLRLRDAQNPLTQKFRILSYLLEIERDYYDLYVREQGTFVSSLPGLAYAVVRSAGKLVKGMVLGHLNHVV